ncbi:PREDICTED: tripartite motif-containing protein 2-like [Branchiostoma belcheri]|uniref:Tripartite motif-containing protein 2-like n=1 Tax=Branchiostoma belcheri TaxID=7741 RepID=A0A6P4XCF8_BRABE|nr:PREDICTED: tripartite motif-containing protein 2-like [Branchiostoma belcheri]
MIKDLIKEKKCHPDMRHRIVKTSVRESDQDVTAKLWAEKIVDTLKYSDSEFEKAAEFKKKLLESNSRVQEEASGVQVLGRVAPKPGPTCVKMRENGQRRYIIVDTLEFSEAEFERAAEYKTPNEDVMAAEEMAMFGKQGSGPGEFQNPRGVAVSADNEILVADTFNRRVQVFDIEGAFLRLFPVATPEGNIVAPEDVCVAGDGSLWIVGKHASGTVAVRYTSDGSPREQIPLRRTAFSRGIAVNPKTSRVVVTEADGRGGEVLMFRPDGTKDQRFGRREGMMHPWFVATDTEGNILVSDYSTKYVYMYNQSGGFLTKFGGHFRYPAGLCADGGGNIIVADSGSRRVEVLTGRGQHVRFAASGHGRPSGVALGPAGQMVVTYGLKNVVAIFTHQDRKV